MALLASPWIAAAAALFLWWFSTGAILCAVKCADRRGTRARQRATLAGLPVLVLGLWGYIDTLGRSDPAGAYLAFLSALALWGWIELAFLTGQITGPNPHPCPKGTPGWERFLRAWGTIAYNEILLVTLLVTLALYAEGAVNQVGLWTFAILFAARVAAKINLFLGVPRIHTDLLPGTLAHVPSHFRNARPGWFFAASVTALTMAAAWFAGAAIRAELPAGAVGHALLAALATLAVLEHWLMVLPLPDDKLWRWMLPAAETIKIDKDLTTEDAHGL